MGSNVHGIYNEHMIAGNYVQLAQMIQLQILLPETLAQLHNLFTFCVCDKAKGKQQNDNTVQRIIFDEVIRINDMFHIIHPVIMELIEKGDGRKAYVALTKVVTEISKSGNTIAKPKWITNEFLCYMYMYYKIPIEKWFVLIRSCSPAFQQAIRTFAIYFQVDNIHSQIFLLSPITQNDIIAACLSGFSAGGTTIASFLSNETDFTFQASPPRNISLDDDDVEMLLTGPEGSGGSGGSGGKLADEDRSEAGDVDEADEASEAGNKAKKSRQSKKRANETGKEKPRREGRGEHGGHEKQKKQEKQEKEQKEQRKRSS